MKPPHKVTFGRMTPGLAVRTTTQQLLLLTKWKNRMSEDKRLKLERCRYRLVDEPNPLLQLISKLAFVLETGREDARRGDRMRESVFDALETRCIELNEEAIKVLASLAAANEQSSPGNESKTVE
jgi:hypothetical protein